MIFGHLLNDFGDFGTTKAGWLLKLWADYILSLIDIVLFPVIELVYSSLFFAVELLFT